uniref:Reverse transcriptase n=1 Tax=Chara braunii TaxID=69332 RepID=A0A388KQL4_CHABU
MATIDRARYHRVSEGKSLIINVRKQFRGMEDWGDFIHPRVVKEARLPTTGSPTPISVTLRDDKTQRFFDQTVTDLPFFLTLEQTDRFLASRRHRSFAHFDVMETGYDFIHGTPWSRRFRSTEADWATNTLVLKTKCGQTYRVPFIGTTATPRPDPPPPEPSVPTPPPSIAVTSPRQLAHFLRQDDVTFFMVNVTDLLHYDPPCPEAELIPLEPDPPSISMAPISTSVPPPSVESTLSSRADADAEELACYTADLEPAVRNVIREYHDVFPSSFSYAGIPPMRDVEHSIQLVPDYRVHHQAPYRLSIPEATKLERQLEELLRQGFIKLSNSPWGAPVLFARKADGTLRLCIDYRGLNRYTVKNSYLMPRSDELFNRLAGNRFFTKIDLCSGYHQIRIAAANQPKTAFQSRFGHYEFTVMPFGLTNAPATFQRAMNDIFRDILQQYVLVYLDDILVYSRTLEEHLRHLRDVLDRLRRHGFYAKLSKCRFAQHKVDFLGHYVSDQGLHMDDAKITAIAEWPAPTSAKQLRSFLGLTSYYSNFIRGYARYSNVLTSTLLRKNPPWAWTPLHEDAFRALKKAVTCAPVLHLPDFDRPFILTADASDFVVGAVLSQVFPSSPDSSHPRIPRFPPPTPTTASRLTPTRPATDEPSIDYSPTIVEDDTVESHSGDCPIAFYSRQLLPAEINYTVDECEVLAVVYAARHWRHYLHGAPFTVRTDNSVVQAFLTKPTVTPRQARWWRDLSEFSFTTEHIKGETNRVADALSRCPDHDQEQIQLSSISVTIVHHSVTDEFRTQYRHCPDYRDIHATLRRGKTVPTYSFGDNGLVYWHGSQGTREPRICVPSTGQLRVRVVAEFHDQAAAGHMGFHKTLARVSRLYVWPKRKDFVKDYVAECPTCQEVNSANHLPYGLLQPLPIPEGRWQSISMDFIGPLRPLTPRGHDAILVVVDRFTKRARFVPCRYAISAREVADIVFDRVVRDHGLPLSIISECDPRFTSRFWRRLHEVYGTRLRFSSSYHPQTDGQTEITNRTLGDILRKDRS